MRKASIWELRVLKERNSDLKGEKQRKKNRKKNTKQPVSLSLRFLRQRNLPAELISSVRWPVPGEAITLNRLNSDTEPASYRCLTACWRHSWLTPVRALFQLCEYDYRCRIKIDKLGVLKETMCWMSSLPCFILKMLVKKSKHLTL